MSAWDRPPRLRLVPGSRCHLPTRRHARARPRTTMRATGALVRMLPPAFCTARVSAVAMAPGPPRANQDRAGATASFAARSNRTMPLPADHGPNRVPKMPSAATAARNRSCSNDSPTRSATAIGPHRNKRYASVLSSDLKARSVRSNAHRSRPPASSIGAGVEAKSVPMTRPSAATDDTKRGHASASCDDQSASPCAVRRASS